MTGTATTRLSLPSSMYNLTINYTKSIRRYLVKGIVAKYLNRYLLTGMDGWQAWQAPATDGGGGYGVLGS